MTPTGNRMVRHAKAGFVSLGVFVGLMWVIEFIDWFIPIQFDAFGIHPRNLAWLQGILFAPLLHGSWAHIIANTPPLLIFGGLIALQGVGDFWLATIVSALVSGIGVWFIAPPASVTVGASGIIFGYLGFLLLRGFFERRFSSILISLGVGAFYSSMIWGVLPSSPNVSWQAHFFGFVGGILAANLVSKLPKNKAF
ncbi:MAG: rhomboid family intramembrane serine protease [Microcoleaceae cyanobacterium]